MHLYTSMHIQVQIHMCMNMHMYKCPFPSSYFVLTFAFPSKYAFMIYDMTWWGHLALFTSSRCVQMLTVLNIFTRKRHQMEMFRIRCQYANAKLKGKFLTNMIVLLKLWTGCPFHTQAVLPWERFELGPDGPSRFPLGPRVPSRFPLGLAAPSSSLVTSIPSLGLFATACNWREVLNIFWSSWWPFYS